MIAREIYFLLPYLLGLAVSLGIAGYVRKYRGVESARFFFYKVVAESLIIAGFIMEMVSLRLETKILWDNVQFVLDLALPGARIPVRPEHRETPVSGCGPLSSLSAFPRPPRRLCWPRIPCII